MNFKTAVNTCLKEKYFVFEGRASRSELWFFSLFFSLCMVGLWTLVILLSSLLPSMATVLVVVSALASLALVIPHYAVSARRLHDVNLSGWWQLCSFIPLAFYLILMFGFDSLVQEEFLMSALDFIGLILVIYYVRQGDNGDNRFGSSPFGDAVSEPEINFETSAKICLREKYATFFGRASRAEFWQFSLFTYFLSVIVILFGSVTGDGLLYNILLGLVTIGTFIPGLAVTARRLHDVGYSGWWQMLPILLSGFAISFFVNENIMLAIIISVLLIVSWIIFILVLIRKGTNEKNRFGMPAIGLPIEQPEPTEPTE